MNEVTNLPRWTIDYPEIAERCAVDAEFRKEVLAAEDRGYQAALILDARSWKRDREITAI